MVTEKVEACTFSLIRVWFLDKILSPIFRSGIDLHRIQDIFVFEFKNKNKTSKSKMQIPAHDYAVCLNILL